MALWRDAMAGALGPGQGDYDPYGDLSSLVRQIAPGIGTAAQTALQPQLSRPDDSFAAYMADPLARTDADIQQRAAAGPPSAGQSMTDLASLVAPYIAGAAPGGSMSAGARLPRSLLSDGPLSEAPLAAAPSSPTGAWTVSDGGLLTPPKPGIIRPRDTYFDYSDMSQTPDVPQTQLDRSGIPTWAKGPPDRWQQLATDTSVFERYRQAALAGMPEGQAGGREWYNTMPMFRAWMDVGGTEEGFRRYMDYVGASSPGNPVPQNVKSASMLYTLDRQGQPFPELYNGGIYPADVKALLWPKDAAGNELPSGLSKTETANLKAQYGLPPGYGGLTQGDWIGLADDIRSGRGFNLADNPKPPSFVQNLMGNYQPVTIDRHNMRLVAPFGGDVPGKAYPLLEGLQQNYAERLGIAPAQGQAATWIGGNTGVKSSLTLPFTGEFEQKLNQAAARNNLTPHDMFRHFVTGELPL